MIREHLSGSSEEDEKMTLEKLIRAILEYMAKHGMLNDLKEKYETNRGEENE